MRQTRKQRRAENRRRHRAMRNRKVITYDDLIARDRNPRRRRRNPRHDGSPTRAERRAARQSARTRSGTAGRTGRGVSGNLRQGSPGYKLVYLLADLLRMERHHGQREFYDNLPDDPAGRRLMKSIWGVAKLMGISTRPALDAFKASHHREIEQELQRGGDEPAFEPEF